MKRNLKHILLTAALSAIFGSLTVSAQDQKEIAKIPFAFKAGHLSMPAGEYTVEQTNSLGLFRMSDGYGHSAFVGTAPRDRSKLNNPQLLFRCWGEQRVLAQIWTPDGAQFGVSESSIEKDLSHKINMAFVTSVVMKPR